MFTPSLSTLAEPNIGYRNGWLPCDNDYGVPRFAQMVYDINPSNSPGLNGFQVITPSSLVTGPFAAVLLASTNGNNGTCTVASITDLNGNTSGTFTVGAGTYIYNVKSIQLANGGNHIAIAYK